MYGPGGSYVNKEWKEILVRGASEEMTRLQQDVGINAEFIIENGSVPKLMKEIAKHTKADVLVIGRSPLHSHLGANGQAYSVIREAGIPVLSI